MVECLIIGDSIAVGTKQFYKECDLVGRGGINTWQFNKEYPKKFTSDHVIISLGTNDHKGVNTFKELMAVRERIKSGTVFWILPPCNDKFCKSDVNEIVQIIAKNHGDHIVKTNKMQSDMIHPSWAGYKDIVNQLKNGN